MRRIYLNQTPLERAKEIFFEQTYISRGKETVPVGQALGRVTAGPVFALRSLPSYPAAAMDGFAVRAVETFAASDQEPLTLKIGETCIPVDTGDPMPEGFDAVIKIEDVYITDESSLEILAPAAPWQHVRPVGEDLAAQEIIMPIFHRLGPADLGALLAGGVTEVTVIARPRVAVIPTGDELVPASKSLERGDIPEFNGTIIAGYLTEWGAEPTVWPVAPDRLELLMGQVKKAIDEFDLVIVNAGSSAGREDYTCQVVQDLGELLIHGVATRPGKPVILGKAKDKPLVGLPGYPVSAILALEWFVRPLIFRVLGQPEPERMRIKAVLGRRVVSELGTEEFIRMTVGFIDGRYVANPLPRGAGITSSMVKAHGMLVIPANSLGYDQGESVELELFRTEEELRHTLVAVGSHDLALDLLGNALRMEQPSLTLSSAHVGSMGGIFAIQNRQTHLAGVHLLDPETGEYNISYIQQYLSDHDVVLINLAYRIQGWMTPTGNPLNIQGIGDLLRPGVRFVNRQRGAGTRMLFDYLLGQAKIDPGVINGYQREEYTHLNVAAAVAAGTADVGLGIASAAKAYGLDFVPLGEERYDLLLTGEFYRSAMGKSLIRVMTSSRFREEIEALGGYSMRDTGKVLYRRTQ